MKSLIILFLLSVSSVYCSSGLPIAVFHGIGDFCLNPGMISITHYFGKQVGSYSRCIESGGAFFDFITSFEYQFEKSCTAIKEDPNFQGDFSVVGLSQGALLARAVIQRCDMKGRVKRFVSVGGPHAGVAKFPHCQSGIICDLVNGFIDTVVYTYPIQHIVGPAGYFKNPANIQTYLQKSYFLADLDNEEAQKKIEYKNRIINLEKVVLIKFSADTMIIPGETAWFSFYDSKYNLVNYKNTDLYKEDWIGIRTLDEQGKINYAALPGNHLQFSYDDIDRLMIPALK